MSKATLKDIADELGLSISTVSRALHNPKSQAVSKETSERIKEVAQRLGYRPNQSGRALATGRSQTVLFYCPNPTRPYYAALAERLTEHAARRGYQLLLLRATGAFGSSASPVPAGIFDAVIACDYALEDDDLRALDIPVVALGMDTPAPGIDHIGVELGEASRDAMRHFLATGCRRIGFVSNAPPGVLDPRIVAYTRETEAAEIAYEWVPCPSQSSGDAYTATRIYVGQRGCPDALFCHNDEIAFGVLRGLQELGKRVPEQVQVIGCDGLEMSEYLQPPLSTIVQPFEQMARLAWKRVEAHLQPNPPPVERVMLTATLTLRGTTR